MLIINYFLSIKLFHIHFVTDLSIIGVMIGLKLQVTVPDLSNEITIVLRKNQGAPIIVISKRLMA